MTTTEKPIRTVHLIAICGTGMGSFAGMLQQAGFEVSGSDENIYPPMSDVLASWKIPIMPGFKAENLDHNPDLVIVGNVCRQHNPECVAMRERGLRYMSFPQALSELFLTRRHAVVVAGTHGKTTTSSMIAWMLFHARRDPSFLLGGIMHNLSTNHRLGQGEHFVIEGDEYDTAYFDKRPKFVHYQPRTAVLTNIEFDHADIYADLDSVLRAFRLYVDLLPEDGLLISWADCAHTEKIVPPMMENRIRYGLGANADWQATSLQLDEQGARFSVIDNRANACWGAFSSPMWGEHNVLNALAALAAVRAVGLSAEEAAEGLATFRGAKRRQDLLYHDGDDRWLVDDFAHHPTAVQETIRAVRSRFGQRRLWALFEAESNTSRRRIFQDAYTEVFTAADIVIFAKPLKKNDKLAAEEQIDVPAIVERLRLQGKEAHHLPEAEQIVEFLLPRFAPGDVVLLMSGRDFQGLAQKLLDRLGPDRAPG